MNEFSWWEARYGARDTHATAHAAEAAMLARSAETACPHCVGVKTSDQDWQVCQRHADYAAQAERAMLARLHAGQPSAEDISTKAECAAAGEHQTARDVAERDWCVVCGSAAP